MRSNKVFDIVILIILTTLAAVATVVWETSFLTSTLLFLGLPSLYLSFKEKESFIKVLLASVIFGLIIGFVFDYIAELNNAWDWGDGLVFGQLLGVVQIDVLVWFFLYAFYMFIFYEHFFDESKLQKGIPKKVVSNIIFALIVLALLLISHFYVPEALVFNKAYLVICLVVCLPFVLFLIYNPKRHLIVHTLPMVLYFTLVFLVHEITALKVGQWTFPGDYIGFVNILGISMPIEELVFWIILSSIIGATYYELTFDNRKN